VARGLLEHQEVEGEAVAELVYHPELVEQPIGAKEPLQFRLPYMSPGSCRGYF